MKTVLVKTKERDDNGIVCMPSDDKADNMI